MFNSQYPTAVTEGKGQLRLVAWAFIQSIGTVEAEVIEANAETQKATLRTRGRQFSYEVNFSAIQCVSYKYDDGTVEKCFGAPKVSKPESVEYMVGVRS